MNYIIILLIKTNNDILRKILVRNNLFMKIIDIPGDIVELGVFKGVGIITWLKIHFSYNIFYLLMYFL